MVERVTPAAIRSPQSATPPGAAGCEHQRVLLAEVVAASADVAATRSRSAKAARVAQVLRAAAPAEVPVVTSWLAGEPRQRKLGVGWRTLAGRRQAAREAAAAEQERSAPGLHVLAVDEALDRLATTSGPGSAARREALLDQLFAAADDDEGAFLVRLLTGELRQGALEGVVLDAVVAASGAPAPLVRRAAMLTGSLPATAGAALAGGSPEAAVAALSAVGLEVGRPVHPMLASPGGSVADALADLGADVVVEPKLDGARIQVHLDRTAPDPSRRVRVWTRTLREITDGVPEIAAAVLALPCRSAVLDGETLALDDDGRPRRFQDTMSRFGSAPGTLDDDDDAARVLLSPFFFDLLHLDGRDLLDEPLEARLAALDGLLAAPEHAPLRMPGARRPDPGAAQAALAAALAAGHEGVVVKELASPYAAGRRGRAWQKVKPVHTLDLVVLAAEWGSGRRTGSLSNIHLGARDPDGGPPVMVGKTFKGMTDELLAWQTATFGQHAVAEPRWGVVLRPELVVEVALDGAQRSSRYPGGVALRFARVLRYRPDKTAADADDLDAVRALL